MIGVGTAGERGTLAAKIGVAGTLDLGAFEDVYRRHWSDVFRYAWLMSRNRYDAEDVASEAFRRALEAWSAGHGPSGETLPWLLVIARRIWIDRQRRSRLVRWLPIGGGAESGHDVEESDIRRSEAWIWFEQLCRVLPASQREALYLRFVFDLPDAAAAQVMGTSAGNMRTLVSRGLATLRRNPEVMER